LLCFTVAEGAGWSGGHDSTTSAYKHQWQRPVKPAAASTSCGQVKFRQQVRTLSLSAAGGGPV
jgi:hypothetical protein